MPAKLVPVFLGPARYRGAHGGRGSAKTRSFAKMTAVRAYELSQAGHTGVILCGREFMNSLDDSSMAEIKEAIHDEPWLEPFFDIGEKYIRTRDGRIRYVFVGLHQNLNSIKSKARIHLAWVDEAESVTETAWQKLIPTVREADSELWITWNPESKSSATHKRFRADKPSSSKIVEMNWRDNPFFPKVLNDERIEDEAKRPDSYAHVWDGGFVTVVEGAYFASQLTKAHAEGRIGRVSADPLMTIRLFSDIGGTGAKADSFVFWAAQFVGREIRWLNYYEQQGQPIGTHLSWLRENGYTPSVAQIWLPHDGDTQDKVIDVSYASAFRGVGYTVTVVPNQGKGAAKQRIEAMRNRFPSMWFDADKCAAGIEALGWYHEKRDDDRGIGLGPNHDWASHGSDAAGLGAICYTPPQTARKIEYSNKGVV